MSNTLEQRIKEIELKEGLTYVLNLTEDKGEICSNETTGHLFAVSDVRKGVPEDAKLYCGYGDSYGQGEYIHYYDESVDTESMLIANSYCEDVGRYFFAGVVIEL